MYLRTFVAARCVSLPLAPLIASFTCACVSQRMEPSSSLLVVGDPRSSNRLLSGFYGAEQNRWRWTGRTFAVALRCVGDPSEETRSLVMRFVIPHEAAQQLLPLEISASVAGVDLRPELFRADGRLKFTREIPTNLFEKKDVAVSFSLNRTIPPSPADLRELGIIVESIGFE